MGHYVSEWNRFWQRFPHDACLRGNWEALYNPGPMANQDSSNSTTETTSYPTVNLVMALIKVS